jgi:hypothetical protein
MKAVLGLLLGLGAPPSPWRAATASWFVSFEPRPSEDARSTMDRDLHRALRSIRTWPETNLYPSLGLR